jgi:hypothetical protein
MLARRARGKPVTIVQRQRSSLVGTRAPSIISVAVVRLSGGAPLLRGLLTAGGTAAARTHSGGASSRFSPGLAFGALQRGWT